MDGKDKDSQTFPMSDCCGPVISQAFGTLVLSEHEDRDERRARKSYEIHKQLDALEDIARLRPYNPSLYTSNTILAELETNVQDSFTLSDIIAFADGAHDYVMGKWGDQGVQILASTTHWPGSISVHRQLDRLWGSLDKAVQERLAGGEAIADIINDLEFELERCNRRKCNVPARFSF